MARNGKSFAKGDFKLNLRDLTITCPAGETERIEFGSVVEFDPEACDHCHLRASCTAASSGTGRTVAIAENERLQHKLRKLQKTHSGRAKLRERVAVEHRLAHIGRRQGRRARYRACAAGRVQLSHSEIMKFLRVAVATLTDPLIFEGQVLEIRDRGDHAAAL